MPDEVALEIPEETNLSPLLAVTQETPISRSGPAESIITVLAAHCEVEARAIRAPTIALSPQTAMFRFPEQHHVAASGCLGGNGNPPPG